MIFYVSDGLCRTHFVGGNCIQRQKNTSMIGVSFSKSVSKVRINVWLRLDHFLGVQKCVLQLPSHTLILTLDTDLEKYTPIILVFFCLWIQFPPHKMCPTKTITNIKYPFFLLIYHFSRPHWRLSSLFLIITFQNMFPF